MTTIARPPKIAKDGRTMSPASLANLKPPYKPGENGHGRVYPLKERLAHALDKPLRVPDLDACAGDQIVYSTLQGAMLREPAPFREVWDRIEGKVPGDGVQVNFNTIEILIVEAPPKELQPIAAVIVEQR